MKKLILFPSIIFLQYAGMHAQINYTVDANAFLGASLEGGNTQVRLADVDQDGHLDLISIGDHGSPNINTNQHGVMTYFGDGTGTNFFLSMNGGFGYGGCAVGDINNDGKQDIAYSCHHSGKYIDALIGDGSGTNWSAYGAGLATNGETYGMFGTDLADINNDGWLDLASNSFGQGNGVHIYKNNQNGTWTQSAAFAQNGAVGKYVKFGDIDGDGNMDFVVSNELVAAYFGNGTGTFTNKDNGLPYSISGYPYEDVSLGDIDNDGDDDFIFSNWDAAGVRGVYVYKWNKVTQSWDNASAGLPTSTTSWFYINRLADMDMDGYLDVITANYDTKNLEIYKGNGGTSWTLWTSIPFPNMYWAQVADMAFGDVNHSGYPDIAYWYSTTGGNALVLIKDDKIPTDVSASLTYPKGGECWPNNAVRFINWISAIPSNHSSSVKIEYSTAGNSGPWTVIANAAPNNGIYQWNVPASVNSSNCFIRITATDNITSKTAVTMNGNPFNMGCNSSTTAILEEENTSAVSVYPNPFTSSVTISSEMQNCSVNIFDLTGNAVRKISNVNQFPFTIERGNLSSGIYFLELRNENKVERTKLVIE
ncbi:MAG: T9SS type A sorting domain-containing protein [Bacteroidetes bacterium]|nr:T9SS type A sorting domain-containing protein [Bacteroidota bacterium]